MVGEADNFLSEGGIIRLHLEQDKIRFDINVDAADSSHLKIGSRLLLLASSVTIGGQAKGGQ
jgi:tRNA threonylcarbamoyladenosine modification (KEOPS) complex  Pcc1 subunit